jgi:hypothetical protein
VDDRHAVRGALVHTSSRRAFEHHDDGRGQPRCRSSCTDPLDELTGCIGAVPPPPRRAGANDIGGVDE